MDDDEIQDDADVLQFSEIYQVIVVDAKTGLSAQQTVARDKTLPLNAEWNRLLMHDIADAAEAAVYSVMRSAEDVYKCRDLARLWLADHPE
jgi:hypothetical protein